MLTPQEVKEQKFEKSLIGGYVQPQVDAFLDKLSDNYESLYKDNATLKAKVKVLLEKLDEYRSVDDQIRREFSSARKKAEWMINDAQTQASELLTAARISETERREQFAKEIAAEEARLEAAKNETIGFISKLRAMYETHVELLFKIPGMPISSAPKAREARRDEAASDIEAAVKAEIARDLEQLGSDEPTRRLDEVKIDAALMYEREPDAGGSDIWEPHRDTIVPKPRKGKELEDLSLQNFGPGYSPAGKKKA